MSQANTIAATLEAVLRDSGLAADRVTRSRHRLRKGRQYPAVGLYLAADRPASYQAAPIGIEYRELELELELCATGPVPEQATDALLDGVNALVMATFAGDVARGPVEWGGDAGNPSLGICRLSYTIQYRCQEGAL